MRNYTIESTLCELSVVMNNVATVDTVDTYSEANHSGSSGFAQEYAYSMLSPHMISNGMTNSLLNRFSYSVKNHVVALE